MGSDQHFCRLAGGAALLVLGWWVGLAEPAAADPPRPTDYRSTITGTSPASDVIEVEVLGGDSFLQLRVDEDHEAVVLGYDQEPYLRFRADGTVEENVNSEATYANASRYGNVDLPRSFDANAEPQWKQVGEGGRYAWHDHRIHWMSPQPPAGLPRGSEIQRWKVELVVDGEPVTVNGVLRIEPAVAWWPWVLVTIGVAALAFVLGRRTQQAAVARVAAAAACLVAIIVAGAQQRSIPAEAGRNFMMVAVPAVGLGCALAAWFLPRPRVADAAGLAAASMAGGWALLRLAVFTKPVLPTDLDPALDRAGTALALGLATAAAVLLLTADRRTVLEAEDEESDEESVVSGAAE
ncbi:MAG TPA: hypothetical protein VGJ86_00245 [Acidimicrobiales bacterium]|jgi:hypothetical protein